jgi:hypothetical protein
MDDSSGTDFSEKTKITDAEEKEADVPPIAKCEGENIAAPTQKQNVTIPVTQTKAVKLPRSAKRAETVEAGGSKVVLPKTRKPLKRPQVSPGEQISLFVMPLLPMLDDISVHYIDNRKTGSFLWILDIPEKHDIIEEALKDSGVEYHFEKRGSPVTSGKAAWRVK